MIDSMTEEFDERWPYGLPEEDGEEE